MSTATAATTTAQPRHEASARPPLARLVAVELRKAVDTRAGLWLIIIFAIASVGLTAGQVFAGGDSAGNYAFWLSFQTAPGGFLVAILAILVLTSEWGARTGLGTFALVPRRQRILGAKLGAVLVLTAAAFVFSAATTAVGTALGSVVQDVPTDWTLTWWQVLQPFVVLVVNVLVGFALGLLLLNAAAAIVVYFAAPPLLTLLFALVARLQDVAPWADYSTALQGFSSGELAGGTQWLQIATASAIWVLLPAALGAWRVHRAEIA